MQPYMSLPMVGRDGYGYITPACSGSPWWEEINTATSPMPSWGRHDGKRSIWLHHPYLLKFPIVRRNQYGCITPAFSGSLWWGEIDMATSPMPSRGPHGGEESRSLHHPCLLGVQMVGRDGYGCITAAFLGSPWWEKINMATSPMPSQVPHGGERSICCVTHAVSGFPWWGEINMATSPLPSRGPHGGERSIWLHHPYILGFPMVGRSQYGYDTPPFSGSRWLAEINMAASHLPSQAPRRGEINMATSPMPSPGPNGVERSILLHHPNLLGVPMVGRDQYGCITLAFSGPPGRERSI